MSAANASAAPSPSHQDESRANEPSMEEILASIRRIIADDQTLPGNRREREERRRSQTDDAAEAHSAPKQIYAEPVPEAPAHIDETSAVAPSAEVCEAQPVPVAKIRHLHLSRSVVEPATPEVEEEEEEVEAASFDDDDFEAAYESQATLDEVLEADIAALADEPLLSSSAATSVASHFEALAASMFMQDEGLLRQYAQEIMRPMLKQWLDDNLPVIVERLVRSEIERVARGGRR